jgi:hypothetical protein
MPDADPIVVDVARDFTPTPGGRYRAIGKWSGEEFRETKLEPLLRAGHSIIVDLDGAEGFTTSFLEEAFGGLVVTLGAGIMERVTIRAVRKPKRRELAMQFVEREIAKGSGKG